MTWPGMRALDNVVVSRKQAADVTPVESLIRTLYSRVNPTYVRACRCIKEVSRGFKSTLTDLRATAGYGANLNPLNTSTGRQEISSAVVAQVRNCQRANATANAAM